MIDKQKINGIYSYEYAKGRVDRFEILQSEELHKSIIGLLNKLGFSNEVLDDFDIEMKDFEGYIFGYSKDIKIHLFGYEKNISLVFDSNKTKKELLKEIEKFFEIF